MRIDTLPYSNKQTQGEQRRVWLSQHSPLHIQQSTSIMLRALQQRAPGTSPATLILGAGACTEVPLAALTSASDEIVLADFDLAAMQQAHDELASPSLRKRVRLLQCDISGGVSVNLAKLIKRQRWDELVSQGARAVFDAAADCLEQCPVPDPPEISTLNPGEFGLVISSLVLSQLFSYPLLDVLDHVQSIAPALLGEQERHRRYQEAAQAFRIRIINAHLHLLLDLLDSGGVAVLLSDIRGFVFNVYGTDHDAAHRRIMPLIPRTFPELVSGAFNIIEEAHWEWLTDLPEKERPGRGYEVTGYILKPKTRMVGR
jgi:hypothetical protein